MNRTEKVKELKKEFCELVEKFTPEEIKKSSIIDLDNPNEIELTLTSDSVKKWNVEEWLANYRKEAEVSTSGIRGPQNVFYYWDYRFPLNQLGVTLATIGKVNILKKKFGDKLITKVAAGEVRYNTKKYVELISRIQAGAGIRTHLPFCRETTPVWMVSYLIFLNDYAGGEYVTSSHAISTKIATKDLNDQGSQFMPEESLEFVDEIERIIDCAKSKGYKIKLSGRESPLITESFNGINMYVDYLRSNILTDADITSIKAATKDGMKITFETVGGCMYRTMLPIVHQLGISETYEWNNKEEDPFFHGVGKSRRLNPETNKIEFFDYSCDTCLKEVVETMGYKDVMKDKPVGHVGMITDPDGDRLVVGQVEPAERIKLLNDLGINYVRVDDKKVFAVYHPTYSFLMTMDFRMKQLKSVGLWDNHSRFMIKTTPSSYAWNEWAAANNIAVVDVPVGFKEIAMIMKKAEKQIKKDSCKNVIIKDIYGSEIDIGAQPRLVFGGEESGGMITGPEELIVSKKGRTAIAMREKSAGEAAMITTTLAAYLFGKKKLLSEYLEEIFEENNIKCKYYFNKEIIYYNESEPDPKKLVESKIKGELLRDKIDNFYLGLSLGLKKKIITIEQVRVILSEAFPDLSFSDLEDIIFVGDGTLLTFKGMFVEIRKSGTDAVLRAYSFGVDKERCELYIDNLMNYAGDLTETYKKLIPQTFFEGLFKLSREIYLDFLHQGM